MRISNSMVDAINGVLNEGWDDMVKAAKERASSGPKPSGGSGIKLGTRYGGGKQKDKPEHDDDKVKKEETVNEDGDCVTKPEAKTIAKGEVKKHEKGMHGEKGEVAKHEKKMHESFKEKLLEREMTSAETKKKERIVMSMKDKSDYFKKKYGKRWKDVMYATATKQAMKEETEEIEEQSDVSTDMLSGRVQGTGATNSFKNFKVKIEGSQSTAREPEPEEVSKTSTPARASVQASGGSVNPVAQPKIQVGEEVEIQEKNESHTHAAHYENEKGEWTGMNLFAAKDDEDAIRQAHEKCKDGCRLSRVERHIPVKEEVVQEREDDEYHTPTRHHVQVQVSKGDGPKQHRKATVRAKEPKHAVNAAIAHYKQQGYTVHDHKYLGEDVEQIDEISREKATSAYVKRMGKDDEKSPAKAVKTIQHIANRHGVKGVARAAKAADKEYGINDPVHNPRKSFVKGVMSGVKEDIEIDEEESGLRMAAHAANREGKKMFSFKGKTYPVKVKKEDIDEAKDPHMDAGVGSQPNVATNPTNKVKELAKKTMHKVKSEMLGKAPGNN